MLELREVLAGLDQLSGLRVGIAAAGAVLVVRQHGHEIERAGDDRRQRHTEQRVYRFSAVVAISQ